MDHEHLASHVAEETGRLVRHLLSSLEDEVRCKVNDLLILALCGGKGEARSKSRHASNCLNPGANVWVSAGSSDGFLDPFQLIKKIPRGASGHSQGSTSSQNSDGPKHMAQKQRHNQYAHSRKLMTESSGMWSLEESMATSMFLEGDLLRRRHDAMASSKSKSSDSLYVVPIPSEADSLKRKYPVVPAPIVIESILDQKAGQHVEAVNDRQSPKAPTTNTKSASSDSSLNEKTSNTPQSGYSLQVTRPDDTRTKLEDCSATSSAGLSDTFKKIKADSTALPRLSAQQMLMKEQVLQTFNVSNACSDTKRAPQESAAITLQRCWRGFWCRKCLHTETRTVRADPAGTPPGVVLQLGAVMQKLNRQLSKEALESSGKLSDDFDLLAHEKSNSDNRLSELSDDFDPAPRWLKIWGVVPPHESEYFLCSSFSKWHCLCQWGRTFYRIIAATVFMLAHVYFIFDLFIWSPEDCTEMSPIRCNFLRKLSDSALSLGSLVSFASLHRLRHNNCALLGAKNSVLTIYAQKRGYAEAWRCTSQIHSYCIICVWTFSLVARLMCELIYHHQEDFALNLTFATSMFVPTLAFAIVSGSFLSVVLALLHITNSLVLMVDRFCCQFVQDPDVGERIRDWNMLQAIMRRASGGMSPSFLTVHTLALILFGLVAFDAVQFDGAGLALWILTLAPTLFVLLPNSCLLFRAAEVTSRCSRVPALINCFETSVGAGNSRRLLELIQYVSNSDAGFYVCSSKLTGGTTIKICYIVGLCTMTLVTRIATGK